MGSLSIQQRFGQRVRLMRVEAGWSQETLGHKAGMQRATIYAIEAGRDVRLSTVALLAKAFKVSLRDMMPAK